MNLTRVSLRNYMPASRCSRDQSKRRQFKSDAVVTDLHRGLCTLEDEIKTLAAQSGGRMKIVYIVDK